MNETKLEAFLAIPMPTIEYIERDDKSRVVLYAALDDLCACSGKLDFPFGNKSIYPKMKLLDKSSRRELRKRRVLHTKKLKSCELLVISANVPLSHYGDILDFQRNDVDAQDCARALARSDFCKRISDLLVMANVGRIGSVELVRGDVVQDDERQISGIPEMDGYALQRAAKIAEVTGWPQLRMMNTNVVWGWAAKRVSMFDGFDGTAMGRAICALSRIFEHKTTDHPMQLLWALVGLEALYVRGKSELLQQVRDKSQTLLGQQAAFKKRITSMYDFRSRFVHGDLDFPGLLLVGDSRDEVSRYDNDLYDAVSIATAVLVATIQEIIHRGWSGVKFDYKVEDTTSAD